MNLVIDGINYVMPMGDINRELLSDLVKDDSIIIDNLSNDIEDKYVKMKKIFDLLCRSVTLFKDDDELAISSSINKLCEEMWRIDSIIVFQANGKNYESAINIMKEFMVKLLEPFQVEYVQEKRQVR